MHPTLAAHRPMPSAATPATRLDLYAPIHKALRHAMCDTLVQLGSLDVADRGEMARTLDQVEALLALCEGHLQIENRFVHPFIEARAPAGTARIADEHEQHLEHIADLRLELTELRRAAPGQRPTIALRLYRHLALFVADNFRHMHVEETAHNALVWAHYRDDELMPLHAHIVASIEAPKFLQLARWMLPALNPAERAELVHGMKGGMPAAAFDGLIGFVRPHLDAQAWHKLAPEIDVNPSPEFVHLS